MHEAGGGGGGPVVFTPSVMEDVAADLEARADLLVDVGTDVEGAIDAFLTSSSEYVPAVPAHGAAIETQAELVRGLATGVLHLAAAAEEADRRGLDLRSLLLTGLDGVRGVESADSGRQAVIGLVQLAGHGMRHVRSNAELLRLASRYGTNGMPDIDAIRREIVGGASMDRDAVRPIQRARHQQLKNARASLLRTQRDATSAMRTVHQGSPLTRIGTRVDDFMSGTRTGRALRTGGKVLGVAGLALGTVATFQDISDGDVEGAVVNGLGTLGSGLMMTPHPVAFAAGAVITTGVIIYENWDTISDVAGDVGDAVSDFGEGLVDGAKDLFSGIF